MKRPAFCCGFTLVELMVSMSIGMAVLVSAVSILGSTGDGYERLGGGVSAEREARALLGQMTDDLASGVFHDDLLIEKGADKWVRCRVGFLTLQPADAQLEEDRLGDLCAVRYYLKDEVIGGKVVRCLMRGFTGSAETMTHLKQKSLSALFSEPAAGNRNADEAIAFGVVSFDLMPKIREKSGKLTDWTKANPDPPDLMVIRLVLARRDLAGKLVHPVDWNGEGNAVSLLGRPEEAAGNRNLQVYETLARFGHHEPK